jgi:hypothetical protein
MTQANIGRSIKKLDTSYLSWVQAVRLAGAPHHLLISALKSKLFPAEDRQPKTRFRLTCAALRRQRHWAAVQISMRKSVKTGTSEN